MSTLINMTDAAITITLLLTVTFAFGMAVGSQIERSRRRRRDAQKEIDWMLDAPPHHFEIGRGTYSSAGPTITRRSHITHGGKHGKH